LVSLLKLDLVMNLFFMVSDLYFSYDCTDVYKFIWLNILFLFFIIWTAYYAISSLIQRNKKGYQNFSIMRVFIELIKLVKTVLILIGINGAFQLDPTMIEKHGNIRFSMLVQGK
jgi:hypothetical protein